MKWALKYSLGEIKECERGNNIEKRNAEQELKKRNQCKLEAK